MTDDAARRARQAANSRAYRARQRAAAETKKLRGATPHGGGVVDAARAAADELRTNRLHVLSQLPDARNPRAKIRPQLETERAEGPAKKTKTAQARRAADIRAGANAQRVAAIGRARKASLRIELTDGPLSEMLQEMNPNDRARFRELTDRIAKGSAQSVGILFAHAGGQGLYSGAIEKIVYELSREEGFDMLETLAEYAETAAKLYAPSTIGRLNI